jgi:hypothetical protein
VQVVLPPGLGASRGLGVDITAIRSPIEPIILAEIMNHVPAPARTRRIEGRIALGTAYAVPRAPDADVNAALAVHSARRVDGSSYPAKGRKAFISGAIRSPRQRPIIVQGGKKGYGGRASRHERQKWAYPPACRRGLAASGRGRDAGGHAASSLCARGRLTSAPSRWALQGALCHRSPHRPWPSH